MGKEKTREMLYWTKEEYIQFSNAIMDKPVSFYAFEILYWCGLRLGEMLVLTPSDFDFEKNILRINKSYQKIGAEDVITDPKTPKSKHLLYFNLLTSGKLNKYLASIDEQPVSIIFYISRMKYSCRSIVTFSHSFIPQNIMQDKRYKQSVSKPFV